MSETQVADRLPAVIPTPAPAATPAPAPRPTHLDDPDDFDVTAAQAEVAAEEGGQTPAPGPTPQRRAAAQAPARGTPQEIAVPKWRFDEAAKTARKLRDENQFLKGQLAAKQTTIDQTGNPVPVVPATPQVTIEQQLQAEGARILAAAKQFDEGELSAVQLKEIELDAYDKMEALRANHLLGHISTIIPKNDGVGLTDQAVLEDHIEQMAAEHPWSAVLNDNELKFLEVIAREEARGLKQPFGTGPAETLRLRQSVAELADLHGPRWYPQGHRDLQPAGQPASQTGHRPAAAAQPTARGAAARRALEVAARQPPAVQTAGRADSGTTTVTEAQIDGMSEDEILALPATVRARLMG